MALKEDAIEKQLEQWRFDYDDEPTERYFPAIKKLPAKLKSIAFALLDRDAQGKDLYCDDDEKYEMATQKAGVQRAAFAKLTSADRMKLFKIFSSKLAKLMEKAWVDQAKQCSSHANQPFRSPKDTSSTADARVRWLTNFVENIAEFSDKVIDIKWVVEWGGFALNPWNRDCLVPILVAAVETKGKEGNDVFEILCQIIRNEHPTARMSNHVIGALLSCNRLEGYELVEKTLLAAQRQEGLRESIVNCIPDAHPDAFLRLMKVIRDENLLRFSSVVREINMWFGLQWDSVSVKVIKPYVDEIIEFLETPQARKKALAPKTAEEAETLYRALWATAFFNVADAVPVAAKLLKHKVDEIRYVAAWFLELASTAASAKALRTAMEDENLHIAMQAASATWGYDNSKPDAKHFARLERLYARLPEKPKTLKPIVWPWTELKLERTDIAELMIDGLGNLAPTKLLPYLKGLDSWRFSSVVRLLSKQKKWDQLTRETLFDLTGHASADVREAAFEALKKVTVKPAEREKLEALLNRKSSDLRVQVIAKLREGKDAEVLESADRLLAAGDKGRRLAGLEMLRCMCEEEQLVEESQARAVEYGENRKKLIQEEETQLKVIASMGSDRVTLKDGLGLMNPNDRTPTTKPQKKKVALTSKAATGIVKELEALVHANRKEIAMTDSWGDKEEKPFAEFQSYDFPNRKRDKPMREQWKKFPLAEVWRNWAAKRAAKLKDKDGLDLLRAWQLCSLWDDYRYEELAAWAKKAANGRKAKAVLGEFSRPKLKYLAAIKEILEWLFFDDFPKGAIEFLLDASENAYAHVSQEEIDTLCDPDLERLDGWEYDSRFDDPDWRRNDLYSAWRELLVQLIGHDRSGLNKNQFKRLWEIERFIDHPGSVAPLYNVIGAEAWIRAIKDKLVTRADIIDGLLPAEPDGKVDDLSLLRQLTARSKHAAEAFAACKQLQPIMEEVRERLLEVELERGEARTVATKPALTVGAFRGAATLFRIMEKLGTQKLKMNNSWRKDTEDMRDATFTDLMKSTYPEEQDTQAEFTKLVKAAIKAGYCDETRLLQLAFLAPQWNKFIETYLKWNGFGEGIYWFIAHMDTWSGEAEGAAAEAEGFDGDDDYDEDYEEDFDDDDDDAAFEKPPKLSPWQRLVLERTPLTDEERREGAVDVGWFHRTFEVLGAKRWMAMAEAAKFAANSAQARKAQFLADVLLGNTKKSELVAGIKNKRLKDHVRLLGLLPLENGAKRDKDIKDRYTVLLDYKKYARTLSGLTKPEAMRAQEVGSQNLARLAGYPDPLRLEWAMEAEAVRDLAKGPVSVTKDGVTVSLSINEESKPELTVQRGEKRLKNIPAATRKKHKDILELNERAKELRKSASRIKQSLESAMCRGDSFSASELQGLCNHALIAPQLQKLVLVGEGIVGYPDKGGKALRSFDGKLEPIKKSETLRIAHAHDLLATKKWAKWQAECFQAERIQPFKQVFRELYVVTSQEKKDGDASSRFAGQQIGPRQAMALWGSRGWTTRDEVFKTFHHASIVAEVNFQWDYGTAAEVEGLTLDTVSFRKSDEYKALKLSKVPAYIFSEVMRDVDLVVSVAHRGEVDPEASASTVEMRANLISETCKLLQIKNVKIKKSHVLIDGEYSEYSLHLGSGNVQRLPGGALAILPVHAQHRGRLFLPFADDDPRTAEIISKTLLLARDGEIQDPSILDQLAVPVGKRKIAVADAPEEKTKPKSQAKGKKKATAAAGVAGKKQHFEFDDGKSKKFWAIEIDGSNVTTNWGRIGTNGQSKTKSYDDEASAQAEYDKLVASKTKKGYEEA
ncbi:MAG: DUF5724 domain-containing protein [Planctomycetota bacterium]